MCAPRNGQSHHAKSRKAGASWRRCHYLATPILKAGHAVLFVLQLQPPCRFIGKTLMSRSTPLTEASRMPLRLAQACLHPCKPCIVYSENLGEKNVKHDEQLYFAAHSFYSHLRCCKRQHSRRAFQTHGHMPSNRSGSSTWGGREG